MSSAPADATHRETPNRRRRADAERNRQRVLDVARELFAEGGDSVAMDEIARRAEVGIGTLYRHFPTKEALIRAASEQRFEEILGYCRTVCRGAPDPVAALRLLLIHIGEVESRDQAFAAVVEATFGMDSVPSGWQVELEVELTDLVRRGQESGAIRPEVASSDLLSITCGLASIVHRRSGDWQRYIAIVLNGLCQP
jgi:AcrR family transcriptional regulator